MTQLAMVQSWQGDWEASLSTALQMRADAERMGAPFIIAMSKTVEGFARFHLSGDPFALTPLREAVVWLEENDTKLALSWNYGCLAEVLALAGETGEAIRAAEAGLARALTWDRRGEAMAHRALGLACARAPSPRLEEALEHLERSIAVARRKGAPRDEAISRFRMAELFFAASRPADALAQLEQALPHFRAMKMDWHVRQGEALAAALRAKEARS
jgi:tetratricopeptide (TPR) repeat protein